MDFSEKIEAYFSGSLPLEEALAFEQVVAADPALAMELQFRRLDRDVQQWEEGELEEEINGWIPGLDILRESGMPLWLMSLLAGSVVVGLTGARMPESRKQGKAKTAATGQKDASRTEAGPASDLEQLTGESAPDF